MLAHLLSIAEAKWAITTIHGHLDKQYIEANWLIHNTHEAMDRHSQSWAMRMAELSSVIPNIGTKQAPADNSGLEQAPTTGAPPPGSTTCQFTTHEGNEAYRAQAQPESNSMHNQHIENRSSTASQAWDPNNEID